MHVFDNRTGKTSLLNAFTVQMNKPKHLFFASPYFTNSEIVQKGLDNGSQIKLIVCLNEITSPIALKSLIRHVNIQIRYFTSKFHSKLYIFGNDYALCGSANLTDNGLSSNQEICIGVEHKEEEVLSNLLSLFQHYWDAAEPFGESDLDKFTNLKNISGPSGKNTFEKKIIEEFGKIEADGVEVGKKKKTPEKIYLHEYKKSYQEFLNAFGTIKKTYIKDGRRKVTETELPLRLEIDQFFNYMRETHAGGKSCFDQPLLVGSNLDDNILSYIDLWHNTEWPFLFNNTIPGYQKICEALDEKSKIMSRNADEIFEALLSCYSFHDRLRYYEGGTKGHKKAFLRDNELDKLQKTISYLLFSTNHPIDRMADCIYNPEYKLSGLGNSGVQELMGWVNAEDIPIYNSRTSKVLRYLGFNISIKD